MQCINIKFNYNTLKCHIQPPLFTQYHQLNKLAVANEKSSMFRLTMVAFKPHGRNSLKHKKNRFYFNLSQNKYINVDDLFGCVRMKKIIGQICIMQNKCKLCLSKHLNNMHILFEWRIVNRLILKDKHIIGRELFLLSIICLRNERWKTNIT